MRHNAASLGAHTYVSQSVLTRSLGPSVTFVAPWTATAHEIESTVSAAANAAVQKLFLVADALLRNGGGDLVSQWSMADVELI